MSVSLHGIGVSRGIAIGSVHVLDRSLPELAEYHIPETGVTAEIDRLRGALDQARQQLRAIRDRIPEDTRADIAAFIDTHLLMLEDTALTSAPAELIRTRHINAEWALKQQRDELVAVFERMDDPYLRTRRDDVVHVVDRILRILMAQEEHAPPTDALEHAVVVADDLSPADTALLYHQGLAALVTESGAPLSHTAIMARSLRIPAVVGVRGATRYLRQGETAIVDGEAGVVVAGPDAGIVAHYRARAREQEAYYTGLLRLRHAPAITRDGETVALRANVELPEDVHALDAVGPDGIGLYRTEYLFMNRRSEPDEEEQFAAYRAVVEASGGKPVTIRSLDLGADKAQAAPGAGRPRTNPALGLRGLRLCLQEPNLFLPQLRAILRASAFGPVRLMLPMVSNLEEIRQTRAMLERARQELEAAGHRYDPRLPVGAMIEIPAAAVCAAAFARELDFLSIGTNDLIQYTLAIDRVDEDVNYLYDPLHPAVLKLIRSTVEAADRAGIAVAMCGEMAGDRRYTRLLLGLGLRDLSMHPSALLEVKEEVNRTDVAAIRELARRVMDCGHIEEVHALNERINETG